MLKILLIDCSSDSNVTKKRSLEVAIVPIGLMYIATYLKKHLGEQVDIRIENTALFNDLQSDVSSVMNEFHPEIVGLRGFTIFKESFKKVAEIVKSFDSVKLVVGGGPDPSSNPVKVLEYNQQSLDLVIIGEGEETFLEITKNYLQKKDSKNINGIALFKDGKIIQNPPREFISDLDTIPFPDYSLIDIDLYGKRRNTVYIRRLHALMFGTRGCPFYCVYCHNLFGHKLRKRSPINIFNEMIILNSKYGIKDFVILDDIFNFDKKNFNDFFDLLIGKRSRFNIYLYGVRGDILKKDEIEKMVEGGVVWVNYSLETVSPRLQKLIRKNLNVDNLIDNIIHTSRQDIVIGLNFMVGLPTETIEELNETMEALYNLDGVTFPYFNTVKIFEETPMYDLAVSLGYSKEYLENSQDMVFHDVSQFSTPTISNMQMKGVFMRYLTYIFSKKRMEQSLKVQRKLFNEDEINDQYSVYLQREIVDIEKDVLCLCK